MIDSGSAEGTARDRLAEIGFAEVERRLQRMQDALKDIGNTVLVAVSFDGGPVVSLQAVWHLQQKAREAME